MNTLTSTHMGHITVPTRFDRKTVSADKVRRRPGRRKGSIEARLIAYVLGVVLVAGASLVAIANQSDRFVGIHEVPPFVCERVELVTSLAADRSAGGVGRAGGERITPDDLPVPGAHNPICARGAGA